MREVKGHTKTTPKQENGTKNTHIYNCLNVNVLNDPSSCCELSFTATQPGP